MWPRRSRPNVVFCIIWGAAAPRQWPLMPQQEENGFASDRPGGGPRGGKQIHVTGRGQMAGNWARAWRKRRWRKGRRRFWPMPDRLIVATGGRRALSSRAGLSRTVPLCVINYAPPVFRPISFPTIELQAMHAPALDAALAQIETLTGFFSAAQRRALFLLPPG